MALSRSDCHLKTIVAIADSFEILARSRHRTTLSETDTVPLPSGHGRREHTVREILCLTGGARNFQGYLISYGPSSLSESVERPCSRPLTADKRPFLLKWQLKRWRCLPPEFPCHLQLLSLFKSSTQRKIAARMMNRDVTRVFASSFALISTKGQMTYHLNYCVPPLSMSLATVLYKLRSFARAKCV